jgi:hypothetical protein
MSPLFGKKDREPPEGFVVQRRDQSAGLPQSAGEAGSPLDAEVARLNGLSLPELAAEVMTQVMVHTSRSESGPLELFNVARVLMNPHGLSDAAESDERMRDLVGEAIQVLEQARLVRLEAWSQGQFYQVGYIVTRLGQAALEQNAVERILGGGSL